MGDLPIERSGIFSIGGSTGDAVTVHRLGFGAMRITGDGIWGEPADRGECVRVVRRAVELGVDFIDTADSYGPFVSEEILREALHPFDNVTIATKGGLLRTGPGQWHPDGRPKYLQQCVEMSLRRLDVERIDLYQFHRPDPDVPLEDSLGALKEMQDAGKIRHIGLSNVTVEQIERARSIVDVVTVQNLYNLANRKDEDVLDHCERENIGFIPWYPIATGNLAASGGALDGVARESGATPAQLAIAWLLRRSPVMLPIPGTKSMAHVEDNCRAAEVELSDEQFSALASAAG